MQLCAVLTKHDLTSIVDQLTPLRVEIRPRRVITLARPTRVELVAGAGLRIGGDAMLTWDVGGLPVPVTVRKWQVMLIPAFVARDDGHVLAFDPTLEELEIRRAPGFLEGVIADAVKQALAAQRDKLAWRFARHLSVVLPLPARVTPGGRAALGPTGGTVTVTDEDVRLSLTFALRVARDPAPAALSRGSAGRPGSPSSRSGRV